MSSIPFRYSEASATRPESLTVFLEGKPYPIAADHPSFTDILEALRSGDDAKVRTLVLVKKTLAETYKHGNVSIINDVLCYKGNPLNEAMNSRIMAVYRNGFSIDPIAKFIDNLMENPAEHAREELYQFLEVGGNPITEDGHFLAYKVVRSNYFDKHTGTMDNSVGKVVEMPRSKVNPNRDDTCSSGLHFCSFEYIKHFRSGNDRLMCVKVNPRDVVSIPRDYNDTKGRACKYLILSELEDDTKLKDNFVKDDEAVSVKTTDTVVSAPKAAPTKLDEKKVRAIRKLKGSNTAKAVAGMYGVHQRTIEKIWAGTAWAHVH